MSFAAVYSILVGIAIIGYWVLFSFEKQALSPQTETVTNRGKIEMRFHITAELITAIVLIIAGISLLLEVGWGKEVFLIAIGMLLYTSVNSAGYFAQIRQRSMIVMFSVIFVLSIVSIILVI